MQLLILYKLKNIDAETLATLTAACEYDTLFSEETKQGILSLKSGDFIDRDTLKIIQEIVRVYSDSLWKREGAMPGFTEAMKLRLALLREF